MKNNQEIINLNSLKQLALELQKTYLEQCSQKNLNTNCYHENEHDNSASHPDYHNDSHDNTPGKMMVYTLVRNGAN